MNLDKLIDEDKYLRDQSDNIDHNNETIKKKPDWESAPSPVSPPGKSNIKLLDKQSADYIDLKESVKTIEKVLQELADGNIIDAPLGGGGYDKAELIKDLNVLFTPILVQQAIENDISDELQEAYAEMTALTERDIIKFDNPSRMAILRSTCALLIARQKGTEKYKAWEAAQSTANALKLEIQKEENDNAVNLSQAYLVNVSTTNSSSVARDAATALLPETQH